ncbi:alpha/beta hydrolase [Halioxenophilus sp. WMMB6]|uniref:alpha/beta fold hydrolase n=1 Tax=Halioxenophilus sp. WMMB6 TaxID=3073815 RepID=UPI00295E8C09|nr:alpha/beta hydrolase [Halioxenophilus sp. WMMB6]
MRSFLFLRYTILLSTILLTACASIKVPMNQLSFSGPQSDHKTLVIALGGLGGSPKDFEKYGFVAALQQAYPSVDLVCPDAHFGYYRTRQLLPRLKADIIEPAKAQGYQRIFLVGVSMGGMGSLLALRDLPAQFAGVVLLAPYSGEAELHAQVRDYLNNGGPAPWQLGLDGRKQSMAELWQWLLANEALLQSGKVWLGYGDNDRLSGHDLLAELLPKERVFTMAGEHKAVVFAELWRTVLAEKPFD